MGRLADAQAVLVEGEGIVAEEELADLRRKLKECQQRQQAMKERAAEDNFPAAEDENDTRFASLLLLVFSLLGLSKEI